MSSFIVIISVPARISNPMKPKYQKNNIVEREGFLYFFLRYFKECIQNRIKNSIKIKPIFEDRKFSSKYEILGIKSPTRPWVFADCGWDGLCAADNDESTKVK